MGGTMTYSKLWYQLDVAIALCKKALDLVDDIESVIDLIKAPSPFRHTRDELADALDLLEGKKREVECGGE